MHRFLQVRSSLVVISVDDASSLRVVGFDECAKALKWKGGKVFDNIGLALFLRLQKHDCPTTLSKVGLLPGGPVGPKLILGIRDEGAFCLQRAEARPFISLFGRNFHLDGPAIVVTDTVVEALRG